MATWKKVVVSGSSTHLLNITASNNLVVSGTIKHIGTQANFGPITSSGAIRATLPSTSDTSYVVVDSDGDFGKRSLPTIPSAANDNTITISAGDGLKTSNDVVSFTTNASSDATVGLAVDVSDFAGTGLKDEGSENLAVDLNGVASATMVAGDSIVFIDANDSNATKKESFADLVTLLAGDGLQNASNTIAIDASEIAGAGLEASGENLIVSAGQTGITSVTNTSLVVGRDNDNLIKFSTDNKIIFEVDGSDDIIFGDGGHITASGDVSASGQYIGNSSGISFVGTSSFVDSLEGATLADGKIPIGDSSNNVAAQTLTGAISITRGGVTSLADDAVVTAKINDSAVTTAKINDDAVTGAKLANDIMIANDLTVSNDLTVTGNLQVNGTTTQVQVANLNVEDRFILLNSGSDSGDGGIIVQTGGGTGNKTGAGFGFDDSADRWVITSKDKMQFDDTAFAAADLSQFVVAVSGSNGAPSGNPADFGADNATRIGMMAVDTSTEDIYIWS